MWSKNGPFYSQNSKDFTQYEQDNQRIEISRGTISRKKRNQQKEAPQAKGKQAQQSDLPCFCFLCSYLACYFFFSFLQLHPAARSY
jgi:hypothetical protein